MKICTAILLLTAVFFTACTENTVDNLPDEIQIQAAAEPEVPARASPEIAATAAQAAPESPSPAPRPPMVALTFDDGPSAYTDSILDLLEQYGGRSTFFVSAPRMLARPDTALRAVELGNEIASHGWSHQNLTTLTDEEITYDLQRASAAIESLVGHSPPMHRPPFGQSDERVVNILTDMGYAIVKWTLDPIDWRYRDADIVYRSIMSQVENDAIILVHDTRPTTAEAMERVIPRLVERGFQLVTVSELLYSMYGGLEPGRIYGTYTILD